MSCPCGRLPSYRECCGRFHRGEAAAPTAELLMRSRYSAFAVGDAAYLLRTWHPSTRPAELVLDPEQEWTGLQVLSASGGLLDSAGEVVFRASYLLRGQARTMGERSRFSREGGLWRYVDALPT